MNQQQAESLAIQALAWLANQPERLDHFLSNTGATPDDLRKRSAEPEFLGFILDFMMTDDATVLAFAKFAGARPETVQQARFMLSGNLPNWT